MMFLFVIMGATHGKAPVGFAPIAIGLCLTLIHLVGIPDHQHLGQSGPQHRPGAVRGRMGAGAALAVLGGAADRRRARRPDVSPAERAALRGCHRARAERSRRMTDWSSRDDRDDGTVTTPPSRTARASFAAPNDLNAEPHRGPHAGGDRLPCYSRIELPRPALHGHPRRSNAPKTPRIAARIMTPPFVPQITLYRRWLKEQRGLNFRSYEALRQWSVTELDAFWRTIWDYFDLQSATPFDAVLAERKMPGAVWFPGATVNYAQQVFRHVAPAHAAGLPAIVSSGRGRRARRAELAGAAPPGRGAGRASAGAGRSAAATASPPICRTFRRRSLPFWPARASARSGASARPTWRLPR